MRVRREIRRDKPTAKHATGPLGKDGKETDVMRGLFRPVRPWPGTVRVPQVRRGPMPNGDPEALDLWGEP